MSFSAPTPPDATQTSNQQQQYNLQAGQQQNQINSYNQSNPFGSINYSQDANSPSGYSLNTSLSAPEQGLFNTSVGTQGTAAGTANNLLQNTSGMYSQAPNFQALNPSQIAGQLNSYQQQYQQPIFNQQQSNLDTSLRNQGLNQGSQAYDNAQNLLARNQGDVTNQYLTSNLGNALQAQNQNFGQQVENYQLPLQTESTLFGQGAPQGPSQMQTPSAQVQPPNYAGQVQQNYQQQNQNYENTLSGLFGIGSSLAGGVGKSAAAMLPLLLA